MDEYQKGYQQGRKEEKYFALQILGQLARQLHDKGDSQGHHWVMTIYRMLNK